MENMRRMVRFAQSMEALSQQHGVELITRPHGRAPGIYVVDLETGHALPLEQLQLLQREDFE